MKKVNLSIISAAVLLFAVSCGDSNTHKVDATDSVEITDAGGNTYTVNSSASHIEWAGSKPIGSGHTGTIGLKEGNIFIENGNITGGKFIFDFASLTPTDQDEEGNTKLRGHLLAPDFLDVENFPEGSFEIASVTEGVDANNGVVPADATHTISGNLTLKGISKGISFPAKVNVTDNNVEAHSEFEFDRTQWNINYESDASIKDKFINKEIKLKLHIVAQK